MSDDEDSDDFIDEEEEDCDWSDGDYVPSDGDDDDLDEKKRSACTSFKKGSKKPPQQEKEKKNKIVPKVTPPAKAKRRQPRCSSYSSKKSKKSRRRRNDSSSSSDDDDDASYHDNSKSDDDDDSLDEDDKAGSANEKEKSSNIDRYHHYPPPPSQRKFRAKRQLFQEEEEEETDSNDNGDLVDTDDDDAVASSRSKRKCKETATTTTTSLSLKRLKKKNALQLELEDLKDDDNDIPAKSNKKRRDNDQQDPEEEEEDEDEEDEKELILLPIEPICSKCNAAGRLVLMRARYRNEDQKLFYSCPISECNSFMWPSDAKNHLPSGPLCHCGQSSLPIIDNQSVEKDEEEAKNCIWVCPKTNLTRCCSFTAPIATTWEERSASVAAAAAAAQSAAGPSAGPSDTEEEFLLDGQIRERLQKLFHVPYQDGNLLRQQPPGYFDYFCVEKAWRIVQPSAHIARFHAFREKQSALLTTGPNTTTNNKICLRPEYAAAVQELEQNDARLEPLRHAECNEVLLLHGTKPQVVSSILENSLDPALARNGLFGSGTYFAEHVVKIDQYTTLDPNFCGSSKRDKVRYNLHQKIFRTPDLHPGNVHYALVCRVVLGIPSQTTRFKERPDPGQHAILAEIGGDIQHFREFVIFDKDAIKIEYLVAYTFAKHYCACGIPVRRRTFHEHETGKERPFLCCDNSRIDGASSSWIGGCGLKSPLPRCYCRKPPPGVDFCSASPDNGSGVYRCQHNKCSFSEPINRKDYDSDDDIDDIDDNREDLDEDRYDYNDGFLVKG